MENEQIQPTQPTAPLFTPITTPPVQLVPPKQSLLPIVILSLLSLIFLSGMLYFYFQMQILKKQNIDKPSPTPTTMLSQTPVATNDPTDNWQTFTSPKYGYSIKFPNNWTLVKPCEENCLGPVPLSLRSPSYNHPDGELMLRIQDSTCENMSNMSWSKSVTRATTLIDNQSGQLITGKLDFNDNKLHDVKNICISFNNQGYHFSTWSLDKPEEEIIFSQILDTFKFEK